LSFLLAAVLLSQVDGLYFAFGPCPTITPIKNFNATAFAGKWFEVRGYAGEINSFLPYKCSENRLKFYPTNKMEVNRTAYLVSDSTQVTQTANGTFPTTGEGKLDYNFVFRKTSQTQTSLTQ
jgi:hypothetical protein